METQRENPRKPSIAHVQIPGNRVAVRVSFLAEKPDWARKKLGKKCLNQSRQNENISK